MFSVQPDVFVEVTRIAKRPGTHGTLERLVSRVSAYVNFESVLAGIDFTAVNANVTVFRPTQMTDDGLHLSRWTGSRDTRPGKDSMLLVITERERRQLMKKMSRSRFANDITRRLELNDWWSFRTGR